MTTPKTYTVSGMSCGHCVAAVTEELSKVDGVQQVEIDLVAGGESAVTVTSKRPLAPEPVCEAIDAAGYHLTGVPG